MTVDEQLIKDRLHPDYYSFDYRPNVYADSLNLQYTYGGPGSYDWRRRTNTRKLLNLLVVNNVLSCPHH